MLSLIACLQQVPPDHTGTTALESREVSATAVDYETARADIASQVPEGWRVIWIRVERPETATATDAVD